VKVFMGICLKDTTYVDGDKRLELKRGKEYTLGPETDGERMLFSSYWVRVPANLVGGVEPLGVPRR
jgi:hypothetical protein